MRISKKLFIGFAVVIGLAVIVGAIGIVGMQKLRNAGLSMYEKQVIGLEYVGKAAVAYKELRRNCYQTVVSGFYDDKKGAIDAKKRYEDNISEFMYWMDAAYKVATTDELIRFHDKIMELFTDSYLPKANEIISASIYDMPDHNNKLYIIVMLSVITDATDRIDNLIIGMMDLNSALAKQTSRDNAEVTQWFLIAQALLLIAAIVVAVFVASYITKSIAVPINEAADVLSEIAKGDFEVRVEGDYGGELAVIKDSVNDTALKLSLYLAEKMQAERSAYESELEKTRVEAASEAVWASITYAGKIQKNLIPSDKVFDMAFSDYSIIWEPRDIVGGDIYWAKNFDEGTILCICDCTGHGTPGALLTMLVVSTFESVVNENNYKDTAEIIWLLEHRLVTVFNVTDSKQVNGETTDIKDGCDLAVLFVAKDGSVTVSAANTHVFVCDGRKVNQLKGQRIFVGEGKLKGKEDIKTVTIHSNPDNKYYIASDGLFDQVGGECALPLGYKDFKRIILENHSQKQAVISEKIWKAFEDYRGEQPRRDDVELITFKL